MVGDVSLNRALTDACDAARRFGQQLQGFATLRLMGTQTSLTFRLTSCPTAPSVRNLFTV